MLDAQIASGKKLTPADMQRLQQDAYSLRAERDAPLFKGWTAKNADAEKARGMIEGWDRVLAADSAAAALYVRWSTSDAGRKAVEAKGTERRTLVEEGLMQAIARATQDWGADWGQWRYGRINESKLPHMFVEEFGLEPIERPGGFNSVNATGANFRRIIDLSNIDATMATNAPGQSAQPGSPYSGNLREHLADGVYFPLPFERASVDKAQAHKLTIAPK